MAAIPGLRLRQSRRPEIAASRSGRHESRASREARERGAERREEARGSGSWPARLESGSLRRMQLRSVPRERRAVWADAEMRERAPELRVSLPQVQREP